MNKDDDEGLCTVLHYCAAIEIHMQTTGNEALVQLQLVELEGAFFVTVPLTLTTRA